MKDRIFWRVIAVGVVLGLYAIGYALCKNGQLSPPSFSSAAYAAESGPEKPRLEFEILNSKRNVSRAKIEGGWLVIAVGTGGSLGCPGLGITFFPDSNHTWNGGSVK